MVLIAQPLFILDDDGCAIAVNPDPKRIAPFAAASDVDRIGVAAARVLVENLAHMNPPIQPLPCFPRGAARRGRATGGRRESRGAGPEPRAGRARPSMARTAPFRGGRRAA